MARVMFAIDGPVPPHARREGRPMSWWLENPNATRVHDELADACFAGIPLYEPLDEPMVYDYADPEKALRRLTVAIRAVCRLMPGARQKLLEAILMDTN